MARLRFLKDHLLGVRFAANVFVGTAVLWVLLEWFEETNPIWAIASMVSSTEPQIKKAERDARSRLINVTVGCAIGLLFVLVGGSSAWKLPLALSVAVLVSSYVVRVPTMWRQAPITAAIVIAGSLTHRSRETGIAQGLHKVAEVFVGCLVGLLVTFLMSKVWPLPADEKTRN
jgi:uncharacterized membrane protein YccC